MRAPCNVGEGLVDGDALDERREIAQDSDGGVAEPLVFVEMSADKNEVGTELPRAPSRHATSYAEGPRFIGGREHDAAADRNRLAGQARVERLLDRRIKGVEVRVENGGSGTHLVGLLAAMSESMAKVSQKQATPARTAATQALPDASSRQCCCCERIHFRIARAVA